MKQDRRNKLTLKLTGKEKELLKQIEQQRKKVRILEKKITKQNDDRGR